MKTYMKIGRTGILRAVLMATIQLAGGSAMAQGPTINGSVYGGGNEADVKGNAEVTISAGQVLQSVYGGGNVANVGGSTEVNVTGGQVENDVFGGGYGQVTNVGVNVEVNIGAKSVTTVGESTTTQYSGNADIKGSVYGGSALGSVNTSTSDKTTVNLYSGTIHGDAYGGGLGQIGREAKEAVELDPAHGIEAQEAVTAIEPVEAMVNGNVAVNQYGVKYEIKTVKETEDGPKIISSGRIFGCNNLNGTPLGSVDVTVFSTKPYNGTEHAKDSWEIAAVYGGGNLAAYKPAGGKETTNFAHVTVKGCKVASIQQVYGGGNAASTPSTKVDIEGSYEIEEVFGGGNGKDRIQKNGTWMDNPGANVGFYEYEDNVTGKSDTKDNRATNYGYGSGEANVNINGGLIHRVFGGSNTKGNVRITAVTMLEDKESCNFTVDEAYGGGKSAPMDAEAKLLMACIPGLSAAYGGAEAADVQGGVTLSITNGTFDRVFGGNNISGTIGGPIVVNIEETGCKPIIIGELYGGGNLAGYSVYGYKEVTNADGTKEWKPRESSTDAGTGPAKPYDDPQVNIRSFTSIGDVYGGGYGESAVMVGNPTVSINESVGTPAVYPDSGNDYDEKGFKGKTITVDGHSVTLPNHEKGKIGVINNVYGGGNEAKVIGNTQIHIGTKATETYHDDIEHPVIGADIRGNVYGGGNKADVTGNTNVVVGKEVTE